MLLDSNPIQWRVVLEIETLLPPPIPIVVVVPKIACEPPQQPRARVIHVPFQYVFVLLLPRHVGEHVLGHVVEQNKTLVSDAVLLVVPGQVGVVVPLARRVVERLLVVELLVVVAAARTVPNLVE